ncbi:MAG: HAD hydrolase family protein [Planctomycetia bacterium]|nr:HAD hydrolase family protein [Planctomycetia bacterium]
MSIQEKLSKIQMILSDVDGVLTDGSLIFDAAGSEIKSFSARDGLGTRIWLDKGYLFGFVTRRETEVVRRRAAELKIHACYQGAGKKVEHLEPICAQFHLEPSQIAYLGDDLVDWEFMRRVGIAAAPADAVQEIKEIAHIVTQVPGGKGVAREVIEMILKAKGEWNDFGF